MSICINLVSIPTDNHILDDMSYVHQYFVNIPTDDDILLVICCAMTGHLLRYVLLVPSCASAFLALPPLLNLQNGTS